ncbi:LPXTG cell wall anchor domain-containing protein [Cellulomonas xiejunii]|uniref:LPXTG cell wall anchor domain-containing protein n=1 Tax=Cellulomonas xiejunii TaxID=2968083 RepID=A0ABY5KVT8_9CELL|nr:LPXTG cell wall anchor domain-containing protein [Cellulomonas xiejunii]MCC2313444.1 LPXTG cell wall anchor domain-containing protein [Cellulomonas xiejunii]MCC2321389.1 LPXTG cell wall anchor domain-containing protein [Cellulomonas xiejunii]UUI73845.1 LPXTG cell wall anchor domain-containing protein [Cellulomonas xiejunii]
MNRRLPLVILSVAALVALPSTAASATGGGHHGSGKPGYSTGYDKPKPGQPTPDKPKPGQPTPGQPTPAPQPTTAPGDLCGGKRAKQVIPWDAYTCDQATGYFLYKKLDASKPAGYWNSGRQHRVRLYDVWAWPTEGASARTEVSTGQPRNPQIIPLQLEAADAAAVCAEKNAYGLQVDLVGDGEAGRGLDVASLVPTVITPPHNQGGFPVPNTLAFYAHYEVEHLVDLDVLCAPVDDDTPSTPPPPPPAPAPNPTPTADVDDEPTVAPTPTPEPSPSETSEVLAAPAETPEPTPTATPAPTKPAPTPTERAEVLSAGDDDTLAATGTQAAVGLLAAIAAIAGGAALVLARRRHRLNG